ncbi:MAG: galactokinase [Verrucomicrobiae bacterium]|nr:galactokinase [Verrucomicrobiae bacterium]
MSIRDTVISAFQKEFGSRPHVLVRAPGRVNLIGEHTDYNEGFVLPMAIDRATWIALRPRTDEQVRLHSLAHGETMTFSLSALTKNHRHWAEYAKGVAWALQQAGHRLCGWEGVVGSDVPIGAGLASSASFELAVARAFAAVSQLPWDPVGMARLCQRAENQWVGVNCGIMDQTIAAAGKAGHALLIDCRSLDLQPVPLPTGCKVVVMDTATRHGLVNSEYNQRRAECEAVARQFGVRALRDLTPQQLPANVSRRARHVVTEIDRTLRAAQTRDPVEFGRLMNASHDSLRDDFEVTNKELNIMVECARAIRGCYGARMTGAGFGGCAVALVAASAADEFVHRVAETYAARSGLTPKIYICTPSDGASVEPLR